MFVSLASFGLVLCGVVFVGRKRRWKTGRTLFVIFLLTFASVMIYSFVVEMPKAYASQTDAQLQQEKVYYFYEDHIGKPIAMSEYQDYDGDGNLYFRKTYDAYCQPGESTSEIWRTNFEPFGVDDYSFNSAGIDVGAGQDCHSTLEGWLPPFRFPGQYADPELLEDFVYNHWRFYMPEIGRYTSPDPLGIVKDNLFAYAGSNPISLADPYGLSWCTGDFLNHYISGNGEEIDLADVGLLDAFKNDMTVNSATTAFSDRLSSNCSAKARELCKDCDVGEKHGAFYDNHYFKPVMSFNPFDCLYSLGKTNLHAYGGCNITADCSARKFKANCNINYLTVDFFDDPTKTGLEFGTPYPITAQWHSPMNLAGAF